MKRLVGNPKAVEYNNGDESNGFDRFYEAQELLQFLPGEESSTDTSIIEDLDKLCVQAFKRGFLIDYVDAHYAWQQYSNELSASWLADPYLDSCIKFLIEVDVKE